MYYALAVLTAVLASTGHINFKKFALKRKRFTLQNLTDRHFIVGVILFLASAACGVATLRGLDFSAFYSTTALNYIFISALSSIYLKERIDRAKIIGNLVVIAGILVYNL